MAGGKETPRQKMIGMMYLVLTALLALNVSSAILEKFAIVNTTLEQLVAEDKTKNETKLKGILDVKSTEPEVTSAKEKAQKVMQLTKDMVEYLNNVKVKIATADEKKALEGEELVQNTNNPEEVMLDKPEGFGYEKRLKSFVKDLNDIMQLRKPFPKLNKKAEDFDEFKNDEEQTKKDFLHFSFEGTPAMAAIAVLSQMQTEVLEYESAALDTLNAIADVTQIKFDKTVPMVRPEANTVLAGATYKADLFIAAASSGAKPEMFYNGSPVTIEEDAKTGIKMGKISFKAPAGNYNASGLAEMSYKVKINVKGKPFEDVIKFNVARPVAKWESEGLNSIYQDCGNELTVSIQGLAESSGISVATTGDQGKVIQTGPGKFVLIPKGLSGSMMTSVAVNGSVIENKKWPVKAVPKPTFYLSVAGAQYDVKKGIPPGTNSVRLVVEPSDEAFKKQNPKDAGYKIVSMTIAPQGKPAATLNSGTIELAKYGIGPGSSFAVYNVQVTRTTWDPNDSDNLPVQANYGNNFVVSR